MSVMMNHIGLPQVCHCGAPATFVYYGSWDGKPSYTCDQHNPMYSPAALPFNFTGHTICPTCGK